MNKKSRLIVIIFGLFILILGSFFSFMTKIYIMEIPTIISFSMLIIYALFGNDKKISFKDSLIISGINFLIYLIIELMLLIFVINKLDFAYMHQVSFLGFKVYDNDFAYFLNITATSIFFFNIMLSHTFILPYIKKRHSKELKRLEK